MAETKYNEVKRFIQKRMDFSMYSHFEYAVHFPVQ